MPEKSNDPDVKMSSSNKCSCCPYGFHIDRDFVRYCDSLYNTAQLDKLRQHKRERRKEKKSVESYLGLGNALLIDTNDWQDPAINTTDNILAIDTTNKRQVEIPHQSSTLPHDLLHNDGLKNAMKDFEETWQMSLRKSSSSSDIGLKRNGLYPIHTKPAVVDDQRECNIYKYGNDRSRNSSTSSASSQSTAISSASVPVTSDITHNFLTSDKMTSSMSSSYTTSIKSSHAVGINKNVLSTIRERMASSLQRMKELEEQVKTIPLLEVKIYALSEEKKSLQNQLILAHSHSMPNKPPENQTHLESQLKRLENEGIMSPTLTRKCLLSKSREDLLASPAIASSLDATITKSSFSRKELISELKVAELKKTSLDNQKSTRNASISCSVLTREIGTGYVPNKVKSIAVGTDISFKDLVNSYKNKKGFDHFTSVSSESLESDSESLAESDEPSRSFLQSRFHRTLPSTSNKINNIPTKTGVNSSTNTEVKLCFSKCINTDQSLSKIPATPSSEKFLKHKSTLASPVVSAKSSQTFDKKLSRNASSQTLVDDKIIKKLLDVQKRDAAIGDFIVTDILCAACKKVKKSVGVGDFSIKSIICDQCSSLQPNFWPSNNASTHKGNCPNCVLRQTETVGVGEYDINQASCQNCESIKSENLEKIQRLSVGTNTLGDFSSSLSISKSDIHICDKCSATIQSVAQGFAANSSDSKIPRPHSKAVVAAKTNHAKLSKLQIQVSKTQKLESVDVKDSATSESGKNSKIPSRSSSFSKTNFEYKKSVKTSEQSPETSVLTDFTNIPALPHKKVELSKEVKAACKVLNDYLQKPDRGGEKKTFSSLTMIQNEWFRVANQKKADPLLIEDYIDAFEEFSKVLLHRVVNLSDNNGNTALHYAISYGNFDVVSILIDSKVCDVNKKNKAGYTSIMLVALANMKNDAHHYVVQRLFNIGDINIKATQNGQTALMLAVSHGKKDIVKILLDAGAEINLQDKDGSTALMCAAEHGHLEIVKLLISHPECDPSIVDNDDCNALTIAMEAGHKDIGLLIYTNMNFSRGSSPYSTLKTRKRSTPRSTPPPRTPTLRTPPLPSPSARSTNSIPSSFHFPS